MKYQQANVFKITSLCLILLFLGLMSASVTHAETYTFVTKWGSPGSENGQFKYPSAVAVHSSGNVYVADMGNHRIEKFDESGTFVTQWGSYGSGDGQFSNPFGVAVDSSCNVYVADTDNNRIEKFDESGRFLTQWGSSGSGDGQFNYPFGVVVDSSGNVYVADTYNNRIQKFAVLLANFTSNITEGYAPLTVQFTDHSKNVAGWNWDFGDGTNSTEQNPEHTYSTAGNYTVNLTVSNANETDSTSATINVSEKPVIPKANFTSDVTEGYAPLPVQFTDFSENATSLNWNFGDGNNSTEQNPVHTYSKAGNYAVNLTASNANGTDSTSATINVSEKPVILVANFTSNVTIGSAPLTVQFTDASTSATAWNWDFGDGATSSEQNPVHTYKKLGKYTVKLTVDNAQGSNIISKSNYITVVTILNPPHAAFSAKPASGTAPLKVTFTDKSTRNPASWEWTFGDGTSSTEQNPVHTYSKAGQYMVKLTVKNAAGSSTKTLSNYIIVNK